MNPYNTLEAASLCGLRKNYFLTSGCKGKNCVRCELEISDGVFAEGSSSQIGT